MGREVDDPLVRIISVKGDAEVNERKKISIVLIVESKPIGDDVKPNNEKTKTLIRNSLLRCFFLMISCILLEFN